MAQLNSTNVIGNLSVTGQLAAAGNSFFNGPVTILSTADAALGTANSGALKIGNVNGEHLSLDSNEIMAKTTDGKTEATLYLNNEGGAVKIGPGGLNVSGNVVLHKTTITAGSTSATCTLTLPTSTGTIALTSQIPATLKNPYSLTIQGNGSTLTNGTYDGSAAKTVNITPGNIGAMVSSPTSIELNSTGGLPSYGGFIDFHFHNDSKQPLNASGTVVSSTPDYTSRIIENAAGQISVNGVLFKDNTITGGSVPWERLTNVPSSFKNPTALTVKGNGTQSFTYDGSAAKTLNIKAGTSVTVTSDTSGNITIASTDTKVTQEVQTSSSYTNWRPLVIGSSNSSTEGFAPSTTTDKTLVFDTLSVQPSTGTIRAKVFKIDNNVKFVYNNTDKCLDVIFG